MPRPAPSATRRALLAGVAAAALPARAGRGDDPSRENVADGSTGRGTGADGAASFGPVARLPVEKLREGVVDGTGTVVYAATVDGFVVVDVSDPTAPRLLAERRGLLEDLDGGPLTNVWDLSVSGDRLLVGGPATGDSEFSGVALYDVADPANPRRVAVHEVETPVHNVFLTPGVAYLTSRRRQDETPVLFVDVRGDDPVEFGAWSPGEYGDWSPRTCHDVVVVDDVLYACYWDLGTWLVDVSTPTEPDAFLRVGYDRDADVGTSRDELPGNAHYARPRPDGDVLAVGKEAFEDEETAVDGAPGGIELWDVSDPATATREFVLSPPPHVPGGETVTAHNFGWRGHRLYASWNGGGVGVYDVADPAAPRLVAGWRDARRTNFWTAVPIHDGFVGASSGYHVDGGHRGAGLFAFPEPSGDGEPARAMEPLALPASTSYLPEPERLWVRAGPETAEPETGTETTEPGTETPTTVPGTETDGAAPTHRGRSSGTPTGTGPSRIPGFGTVTALAASGVAAWRRRDRS